MSSCRGLIPRLLGDIISLWLCNSLAYLINTYALDSGVGCDFGKICWWGFSLYSLVAILDVGKMVVCYMPDRTYTVKTIIWFSKGWWHGHAISYRGIDLEIPLSPPECAHGSSPGIGRASQFFFLRCLSLEHTRQRIAVWYIWRFSTSSGLLKGLLEISAWEVLRVWVISSV